MSRTHRGFGIGITLLLLALTSFSTASAQQPGDTAESWATWWFGVYGGVNLTMPSGEIVGFNPDVPSTISEGSGLGPAFGLVIENNSGSLLGFTMKIGYDARPVDFDPVTTGEPAVTEELSTSLSYLSIDPSLRLNLGSRFFHLLLGPTFGINLGKGSDYTFTDTTGTTTTESADLEDVRGFLLGAHGTLGYDIPLNGADASTQILLTPFVGYHLGLQEVLERETSTLKISALRAGLPLKFGSRPTPPIVTDPEGNPVAYDFRVDAPMVIAESRRVEETFPLRNYVFFENGNTAIPTRYATLDRTTANGFREEQLLNYREPESGPRTAQRSQRQMEVYYNVLNVFGDRLRRNPAATVTLTGSANGDAAKGKEMAENVKNYLVQTFGIAADRITATGQAMPPHKSGTGGSMGEDRELIDAENWRVEIAADPLSILDPVDIISLVEEPIGNDIVFRLNADSRVESATVEVTERGGGIRSFGPYSGTQDVRIDAGELLGDRREARYSAMTTYTLTDGEIFRSKAQEFRLVRADPDEEQSGLRYSILFEFDQSTTVQTYEKFLREEVAPTVPNGATIIVHGHTDIIGKPEYNDELSNRRVEETRRILTDELTKLGRTVVFDSFGFGENTGRAPFSNTQPEQRYYNRTVVIEIVPGG